jgi:hypothetical protein
VTNSPKDPPTPGPMPQHLRDKVFSAEQDHRASLDALRAAVCDYVDELRGRGMAFDDVVHAVRSMMAELHRQTPHSPNATKYDARIVDTMIQWCGERSQVLS